MRIERLSDDRVRVTLTETDLMGMNIKVEQLRPDSHELHTFLFNIMETVKEETDFNPYNGQVVVEAMPSNEGISIVISKICAPVTKISPGKFKKVKSITPHLKEPTIHIFSFRGIDEVCEAIIKIDEEMLKKSALYKLDGKYYYALKSAKEHSNGIGVLIEYSSYIHNMNETFLKEHGELIAESDSLVSMADGVKNLQ